MDWLIDTTDTAKGSARALSLLEDHLARHAADPTVVEAATASLARELTKAVEAAAGRPLHVRLDWIAVTPQVALATVAEPDAVSRTDMMLDEPVPARHRQAVRALATEETARIDVAVQRRGQHTFDEGPPPSGDSPVDPESQGPAAVAIAMATALEAHPSATAPQVAVIAGSMIATAGTHDEKIENAQAAADAFVRLHRRLGSDAYVVAVDEDTVEVAVSQCPFGTKDRPSGTLCHVSSGLAGQIAARVKGEATVVLDESIANGDPECHLQVLLRGPRAGAEQGDRFYWPPRGAEPPESVPHLDLSVSLPRESVSVPVVRRLAAQALRAFGVHDSDVDDVQLAITEACANVIDHAGETDTYDVKVELAADRCAITVIDQGSGFDAATVPDQVHDDAEMGRGLALMRALVDNVAFRNEPRAGAVVHMVKALSYDTNHPLRRI